MKAIVPEAPQPQMKEFWDEAIMPLQLADIKEARLTTMDDETTDPLYDSRWPEQRQDMDENIERTEGVNGYNAQAVMEIT